MIISYTPGRVRIRKSSLKKESVAKKVIAEIEKIPGYKNAAYKPSTGSILLHYNEESLKNITSIKEFNEYIKANFKDISSYFTIPRGNQSLFKNKPFYRIMAVSLIITAVTPFVKGKTIHIISGIILTLFTSKHMYDSKSQII